MDIARGIIGIVARLITYACFVVIVGDAFFTLWRESQPITAIVAVVVFPITIFIWPWTHDAFGYSLIYFFAIAAIAYPISTFIGGMEPL